METILTAAQFTEPEQVAPPWLRLPRLRIVGVVIAVAATLLALALSADSWLRTTMRVSVVDRITPPGPLFEPAVVIPITVSTFGQTAPWVTTDQELRHSAEMCECISRIGTA